MLNPLPHNQVRGIIDDITTHVNEQIKKVTEQAASQSSADIPQPPAPAAEA